MKNYIHRLATYTAVVLISAIPFALDAGRDQERDKNEIAALTLVEKDMLLSKRKLFAEDDD